MSQDQSPAGVPKGIPLFQDTAEDTFIPLGVVATGGGSEAGAVLSQIIQPSSVGSVSLNTPSANRVNTDTYGDNVNRVGLMAVSVGYHRDPIQATVGIRRNTGGLAGSIAIAHNAPVQAQDVRSFLYGVDTDTTTQSVPLLATAAGLLRVSAAAAVGTTIPSQADLLTTAATVTVALAANTARRFAIIQNLDATNSVRVGDASIGAARGVLVAPGETVTFETTAEISVFPVAATPTISRNEIAA